MSDDTEPSEPSIDDPEWLDRIVASALDAAGEPPDDDIETEPRREDPAPAAQPASEATAGGTGEASGQPVSSVDGNAEKPSWAAPERTVLDSEPAVWDPEPDEQPPVWHLETGESELPRWSTVDDGSTNPAPNGLAALTDHGDEPPSWDSDLDDATTISDEPRTAPTAADPLAALADLSDEPPLWETEPDEATMPIDKPSTSPNAAAAVADLSDEPPLWRAEADGPDRSVSSSSAPGDGELTPASGGSTTATVVIDPADLVIDAPSDDAEPLTDVDLEEPDDHRGGKWLVEWGAVIFAALAVAFLIRVFLLQAFSITSVSMEPTLNDGDRVMVNKLSYDVHDVNFGDVVVFNRPPNEPGAIDDLIKRVIATGGQTIDIREGAVYIDGRLVIEPYLGEGVRTTPGIRRAIIESDACSNSAGTSCTVPDGQIFVLGDNRLDSFDSRNFGPIDEDLVVGRAFLKFWPLTDIEGL